MNEKLVPCVARTRVYISSAPYVEYWLARILVYKRPFQFWEWKWKMGKGSLSYAATVILQAISSGYLYGFDIIDITGLPGGTVYPALRRLEEAGYLSSQWEKPNIAQAEPRPQRKYYELTRPGREILAEAVKRYRLMERTPPRKQRQPKPSRA